MVVVHVCVLGWAFMDICYGGCSCMCVREGVLVCVLGWGFMYVLDWAFMYVLGWAFMYVC
jgi:hypothetical protein